MTNATGTYKDWRLIDYQPAIPHLLPHALLPHVFPGQTALEIGCGRGAVSLYLARQGLQVLGIDINAAVIAAARQQALSEGLGTGARFEFADIISGPTFGSYDLVLLIRVLTCFPARTSWELLLRHARSHVKEGGLIYIHDFLLTLESANYSKRYEEAVNEGSGPGNFAVNDRAGRRLFIAHHHSAGELEYITTPYDTLWLHRHKSLSMNGNACNMFEFLGRLLESGG